MHGAFDIGRLQKGESCVEGRLVVELKSSEELASRQLRLELRQ